MNPETPDRPDVALTTAGHRPAPAHPAAAGADSVYWVNIDGQQDLPRQRGWKRRRGRSNRRRRPWIGPCGLAIDAAAGRLYWANRDDNDSIDYANLDGSGGGLLNTAGATGSTIRSRHRSRRRQALLGKHDCGQDLLRQPQRSAVAAISTRREPRWRTQRPRGRSHRWAGSTGPTTRPTRSPSPISTARAGRTSTPAGAPSTALKVSRSTYRQSHLLDQLRQQHDRLRQPQRRWRRTAQHRWSARQREPVGRRDRLLRHGSSGATTATTRSTSSQLWRRPGRTDPHSGATLEGTAFPVLLEDPTTADSPVVRGQHKPGSTLTCSQGRWRATRSNRSLPSRAAELLLPVVPERQSRSRCHLADYHRQQGRHL